MSSGGSSWVLPVVPLMPTCIRPRVPVFFGACDDLGMLIHRLLSAIQRLRLAGHAAPEDPEHTLRAARARA